MTRVIPNANVCPRSRGAGGTFMDSDETGLGGLLRPGPGKTMSGGKNGVRGNDNYGLPSGSSIPFFAKNDTETGLITAQLSTDIELNCTVENLGDKTFSTRSQFASHNPGAGGTFMDSDETGLGGLLRPGPGKTMSGGKNGVRGNDNYGLPSGSSIPFFAKNDTETGLITAQLSTDIELNCTVENLGDKTVSWFRRFGNETHLLTVGLNTYIRDSRVSLTYVLHNNWQLRIANTETSDAGTYLCEVSTHPPIHREVQLKVVALFPALK
ncbi:unnamed protein product [Notodromas monacha]|uniref:Ig-like domain-containing protein n=1 Tax=Notodromas monacha TaxID=399045 RepID=A0A7R9GE79_9CRUS|nr:unnamed protein product [Notodromas monacha]CAG0919479.1 unnamed protein product [Notodromas monacha]